MDKKRITPYPLRMPDDLREWWETEAIQNGRSLNAEIVYHLKQRKARSEGQRKK